MKIICTVVVAHNLYSGYLYHKWFLLTTQKSDFRI